MLRKRVRLIARSWFDPEQVLIAQGQLVELKDLVDRRDLSFLHLERRGKALSIMGRDPAFVFVMVICAFLRSLPEALSHQC